jgi:NAD(P)-dependent dehydrogenase (short-subunit alcohol dehydrogenase family)
MSNAYVITGPTSGYGRRAALELARHGTLVLVGRDRAKLDALKNTIENAVTVECDVSDLDSVARAAASILALDLTIVGLVNNAGIQQLRPTKNARGWDLSFATNHLGPFALTEALVPHLPDAATVVFICSAVEDPERKPAKVAGFRGGRYISAEASARGEWAPGGAANVGFDAYATSKQCNLAATLAFARTTPRLRFIAVEPGFNATTGLGRDAPVALRIVAKGIFPLLAPLIPGATYPGRAGRVIASAVLNERGETGVYLDERGRPMRGSPLVHDPQFQDRVVAETRAFLARANTAAG